MIQICTKRFKTGIAQHSTNLANFTTFNSRKLKFFVDSYSGRWFTANVQRLRSSLVSKGLIVVFFFHCRTCEDPSRGSKSARGTTDRPEISINPFRSKEPRAKGEPRSSRRTGNFRQSSTQYPDFYIYKRTGGSELGFGRREGKLPSFSDILSISRGIFKWPGQQQVVNPFFKGFAWHRFGLRSRRGVKKEIPSGEVPSFPSFFSRGSSAPPPPLSSRRQHHRRPSRVFQSRNFQSPSDCLGKTGFPRYWGTTCVPNVQCRSRKPSYRFVQNWGTMSRARNGNLKFDRKFFSQRI